MHYALAKWGSRLAEDGSLTEHRYPGLPVYEALELDSPYYLVTQVRSAIGAKPKHRGTLRSLALGAVGRSVVVPGTQGLLAAVRHVEAFLVATPVADPSEVGAVRLLGQVGRSKLASHRQRYTSFVEVHFVGEVEMASPQLTEAVQRIIRMVRPELDDAEVAAAAGVIADDLRPDATTVDMRDVRRAGAAAREAIARAHDGPASSYTEVE